MCDYFVPINGIEVPRFLYRTAWKEERSQHLTKLARQQGFRGIDTANQRRHYHEAAVGQAISASIAGGLVERTDRARDFGHRTRILSGAMTLSRTARAMAGNFGC